MSKISEEERQHIYAEEMAKPRETRNQKDAREIEAQQKHFRVARARREVQQEKAAQAAVGDIEARIMAAVDQRVADLRAEIDELAGITLRHVNGIDRRIDEIEAVVKRVMAAADSRVEAALSRIEAKIADPWSMHPRPN
jgi:hypothetical protein